jgi:outer membrane protein, multidrug efflux system
MNAISARPALRPAGLADRHTPRSASTAGQWSRWPRLSRLLRRPLLSRLRPLLPLLPLLLMGACASAPPPEATLPASANAATPAAWQRAAVTANTSTSAPVLAATTPALLWAARFDAPELPELLRAAWAASPDLASAAARIERARATLTVAQAAGLPQLGASAQAQRGRSQPAGGSGSGSDSGAGTVGASTVLSAGVQAAWELDLFGGLAAGSRAAGARVLAAQAQAQALHLALTAETTSTWLAHRACQAQQQTLAADSASRAEIARLTALRARAGFAAPADEALSAASAAQGRMQEQAQAARCENLLLALAELTGLDVSALRSRLANTGVAALPAAPRVALPDVPAALLQQRPDLMQAQHQWQAAAFEVDQARARQYPHISLAGSIGAARIDFGAAHLSGSTWSIGPLQISLPLLDGGARAAGVSAAQAGAAEAQAQILSALRRAVREVEQALVALHSASAQRADAERASAGFEASLRASQARQRSGLASLFELEDARRTALAARSALIELEREQAQAGIDLYRSLGGDALAAVGASPAAQTAPKQ